MDTFAQLNQLLESLINPILGTTGPVSLEIKIFFLAVILAITLVLLYLLSNLIASFSDSHKKGNQTSTSTPSSKNENLIKYADLFYYQIKPTPGKGTGWQRTNRGIRGLYLAKETKKHQQSKKELLVIRFNGDWFFFHQPKILASYQFKLFEHEKRKLQNNPHHQDFNWASFTLQPLPQHISYYQVKVNGHYPHLVQNSKRVYLLLVRFKDQDITKEDKGDRYLLFEEIELLGGISRQKSRIYLWSGDQLTEQEIKEAQQNYLDLESREVKFDTRMMI